VEIDVHRCMQMEVHRDYQVRRAMTPIGISDGFVSLTVDSVLSGLQLDIVSHRGGVRCGWMEN